MSADEEPGGAGSEGAATGGAATGGAASEDAAARGDDREARATRVDHGVHTDPAALVEFSSAAEHEHAAATPSGAVTGYNARRTLRSGVELRRQFRRRRTHLVLGLAVTVPLLLVLAFELGSDDPDRRSGGFIDLATVSAPNFVVVTLLVSGSFLLPMVVALFFGDTVASEASWSSLKYLLAIPVPRLRLLRQKALVAGALSVLSLTVLPGVALVAGVIWYGADAAISPTGESAPFGVSLVNLLLAVIYIVVQLSWVAGVAMFLSVSTDAPLGAVGGAVLATIISLMLDQITALEDLRVVLPTHHARAWTDLLGNDVDWSAMADGAFTSLCYATLFGILAARAFARKDVTS
ncbi:ABC transporter permease [Haloechinothrix halophila]|uniref:ABC transporter permease n=1 Tax=Haloechinothrix halophila TaxID=1069073 RepID=UPI000421949A|nr:ABC transporter permease [Haloechinothrix halophila]